MRTLAFIPARGGSKGIPRKNLVKVAGKPLIQYTLDVVRELVPRLEPFISTDDEELAAFCEDHGFVVSYRRPAQLASDEAPVIDAIEHGLDWIDRHCTEKPTTVLMLQPTSPLRTTDHVVRALDEFQRHSLDALVSVSPMKEHPFECMESSGEDWRFLRTPGQIAVGRQQYPSNYHFLDGSIYMATIDFLLRYRTFLVPGQTKLFEPSTYWMPDIDGPEDLAIAEALLRLNKG